MKKSILILIAIPIILFGAAKYLEWLKENRTFPTQELALDNILEPSWKPTEFIETVTVPKGQYSYVFYYSNFNGQRDYIQLAEFEKVKNGWKLVTIAGVGFLDTEINYKYYSHSGGIESGEEYGFVNNDVVTVKRGSHEALMIPVKNKKIWFFANLTDDILKERLEFVDEKGNVIARF
ncbi:hypothetical protein [Bacillus litorisediminis]|uniref:hypothetical protein n=1 Tax=Bacillus litorisediminis TaxID=2922713 RepID=UPI001FADBA13|nr:hypothetical protein [Bacillus litorisediminis]